MERVETKQGCSLYIHEDRVYRKKQHRGIDYFQCNQVYHCRARGQVKRGVFHLKTDHTHFPDNSNVQELRFKHELRTLARTTNRKYRDIYDRSAIR